jgi:hypothetical protein
MVKVMQVVNYHDQYQVVWHLLVVYALLVMHIDLGYVNHYN